MRKKYLLVMTIFLWFITLSTRADYAPPSSTEATINSKISMNVIAPSCSTIQIKNILFGTVGAIEVKEGSRIEPFFIRIKCETHNSSSLYLTLNPRHPHELGNSGYISSNVSDIAFQITWNSTNIDDSIKWGQPVIMGHEYSFDKIINGFNEFHFNIQLVSWPLNTLPALNNDGRRSIETSLNVILRYL